MIELIPDLPENVLGFRATGDVTVGDYETVIIPAVEARIKESGKIRVLAHLGPDFTGFKSGVLLQDAKLGLEHIKAWEKIAVVTDQQSIRDSITTFGWLIPGEIELFYNAGLPDAIEWAKS
jgi:hypothetical protein